jgi:hypothetical protein
MSEHVFPLGEFIKKGLAPNKNKRNNPMLILSEGMFPYEGVLQSVRDFTDNQIDFHIGDYLVTDSGNYITRDDGIKIVTDTVQFPYPQIWVLTDVIVVAMQSTIMELEGSTLVSKIDGITAGDTYTLLDYYTFIYMSNGVEAITKNPLSSDYTVNSTVPIARASCDFNGQAILGGLNNF